ncbi:hypothetical protein [Streptacidiphilus carbonis]|uniref:hypothetical protein n=1 Tax=Streptacidiphilus carbonis TaxID=105422 RepID=UPI0005AB6957|nr:hypothetical protein [Streptacidiphilus carbonis]
MKIDWAALGNTFGVSLLITLGVVTAFCLGVSALSRREAAAVGGAASVARGTALAVAVVSFTACAAAVGYGLYLIAGA